MSRGVLDSGTNSKAHVAFTAMGNRGPVAPSSFLCKSCEELSDLHWENEGLNIAPLPFILSFLLHRPFHIVSSFYLSVSPFLLLPHSYPIPPKDDPTL